METRVFEFKFPNGDFEIDATTTVPRVGDVIRARGRMWEVERIEPSTPWMVVLRSMDARERETAERGIASSL